MSVRFNLLDNLVTCRMSDNDKCWPKIGPFGTYSPTQPNSTWPDAVGLRVRGLGADPQVPRLPNSGRIGKVGLSIPIVGQEGRKFYSQPPRPGPQSGPGREGIGDDSYMSPLESVRESSVTPDVGWPGVIERGVVGPPSQSRPRMGRELSSNPDSL